MSYPGTAPMTYLATILYEDEARGGETKEFGPHNLVVACVADRADRTIWDLRVRIDGRPMKGDSKIVKESGRVELIAPDCHPVVMLLDNDQIRRHLGLPKTVEEGEVTAKLKAGCPEPDKLNIFLLERNVETLVEATASCIGYHHELRKDRLVRDTVLNRAAYYADAEQRACILKRVPELGALVAFLVDLVRADDAGV